MFFCEPEPTSLNWNFQLFGHGVRVHPLFWLTTIFLGLRDPEGLPGWILAVFISTLIHEMGHIWAMRRYGGDGDIVLYSFGGLAIPRRNYSWTPQEQIVVSAAGPGAGFLLAAAVILLVKLTGGQVVYFPAWDIVPNWYAFLIDSESLINGFINDLLWTSIFWGFMNLLPILPLDGGRISECLAVLKKGEQGRVLAYQVSFVCATVLALLMLVGDAGYLTMFYASLAFGSFQFLQQSEPRWRRYD